MTRFIFIAVISLLFTGAIEAEEQKKLNSRVDWFVDARFGMFVHWGLYSMLEGSWNGRTMPDETLPNGKSWYAEWVQMRLEVPRSEYRALAEKFNPVKFDADAPDPDDPDVRIVKPGEKAPSDELAQMNKLQTQRSGLSNSQRHGSFAYITNSFWCAAK